MRKDFNTWMRDTIKSVHYANNEAMLRAFEKQSKAQRLKKENYKPKQN
jgi:hypothetical protein